MADTTDTATPDGPPDDPGDSPLERIRRYQEILNDFGLAVSETKQLTQILQVACVQAGRGLGIRHTKVMRYRPSMGDLLMEAGVGWKPGVVGQMKLGTDIASPPGRAMQTRRPVFIDRLRDGDHDFRISSVLREHGIVSLLNVPVSADGVVWGVLEVDSERPRHFSQDDVVFLSTMAKILGLAIQGRVLEKQSRDHIAHMTGEVERQRMLMRELIHRDKNDFQMIMSILLMQRSRQSAPEVQQAFTHVMDRVSAISMAHDQLAMRPEQPTIDTGPYLRALCGNLGLRSDGVTVETQLDSTELTHERAVSLGLITNELVTNAIKHAFPNGTGTVRVEFSADPSTGQGQLIVSDDGAGMGDRRTGGSGLQLVENLAHQIGGSVERVPTGHGTRFTVSLLLVR